MLTRRTLSIALSSTVLLALTGCGSTAMIKSDKAVKVNQGEATIVFMRASMLGAAITAAVYDVTEPESKFIGLIDHSSKLAYSVTPGEHTFMVVSEAADFMKVTASAGKTYYALVTPRPGAWRARFSFKPLRQADLNGPDFPKWDSGTQLMENSPKSEAWAAHNASSVNAKRASYWAEWSGKAAVQQDSQTLREEDGR